MTNIQDLPPADPLAYQKWLDEILPLAEGAKLRKTTPETALREYKQGRLELILISARRYGMRRRVALAISPPTPPPQSAQTAVTMSAPRTAKHAQEVIQNLIDHGFLRRIAGDLLVEQPGP